MLIQLRVSLIFTFLLLLTLPAFSSDTLSGKIESESGEPVANVHVVISKKYSGKSDENGMFRIFHSIPLSMPLDVKIKDSGYHLNEYIFLEDENFLEVYVKVLKKKPDPIVQIEPEPVRKVVAEEKAPKDSVKEDVIAELPPLEDSILDPEIPKTAQFEQYKDEINNVVADLKEERKRIEENNKAIQQEIVRISEKLNNEENLTDEQRAELEKYILTLERTVQENNEAFAKAQERTSVLIGKLKEVIAEKDAQIAKVEQEKALVEKRLNRNIVIFSIISFSLLLLAVVFYTIAYKMKNQKRNLIIANSELMKSQNELKEKMDEMDTHRKIIEEQNEKLDIFAYKVSHDLKGPLRSINKLAELAQSNKDKFPEEELNHIGKTSLKLNKLIDDFLDMSKSKEGKLQTEKIDFAKLVGDCVERLENMPEAKNVSIQTSIAKDIDFESDERVLLSIIQNLLENAIKYQDPQKGKKSIKLSIEKSDTGNVEIEVKDNGLGINREELPHIFEMFYKVDPESNGTGLGLYLTRSNVEKIGGAIEVESEEGQGTTFTVKLSGQDKEVLS